MFKPQLDILYEDENLLLVNKRPGLVVHPDEGSGSTPSSPTSKPTSTRKRSGALTRSTPSPPALCNRIDRNTGGIVIAAKNAETLRIMNQKIRDREVEKSYLCLILGSISPPRGSWRGTFVKDEVKKQVSVHKKPVPGGRTAVTLYRTLARRNGLSLVACRLVTGRTHQIRAQFAAAGHPLLGDGKYGRAKDNKRYGRTSGQALCSYQLTFRFTTDAGCLEPLNGRTWTVDRVDFVEEYFPGVALD